MAPALVTAGVTLAGMGATLRLTAFDITGMTDITSGLMVMGAALAITGAISGIANWRVSRGSDAPADNLQRSPERAGRCCGAARDPGPAADSPHRLLARPHAAVLKLTAIGAVLVGGLEKIS